MWIRRVNRKDFLSVFLDNRSPTPTEVQAVELTTPPSEDDLVIIWPDSERTPVALPYLAVTRGGVERDFLSWAWVYLPQYRPFTSFCRCLGFDMAKRYLQGSESSSIGRIPEEQCLGLIIAEAETYTLGRALDKPISPIVAAGTYSYSVTRGLAQNSLNGYGHHEIGNAWFRARSLARAAALNLSNRQLELPWTVLLESHRAHGNAPILPSESLSILARALTDVHVSGDIGTEGWTWLVNRIPDVQSLRVEMTGPLENRVRAVVDPVFWTKK